MVIDPLAAATAGLLTLIPGILACGITIRQYFRDRHPFVKYLALACIGTVLTNLCFAGAYGFVSTALYRTAILIYVPLGYWIILLLDTLSREELSPKKIGIISLLSAAVLLLSANPDQVYVSNGQVFLAFELGFAFFLIGAFESVLWVYYVALIHKQAPPILKKYSAASLVGSILMGLVTLILISSGMEKMIPGIGFLSHGIGSLIFAAVFAAQPRLAYILPFRVLRLTVVETKGGIPLFTHTWSTHENLIDDSLFSGMLQGISALLDEALHRGNLREIHVDQAILLIKRSEEVPIAFIVVASRASPSLRAALDIFARRFVMEFRADLQNTSEIGKFGRASALVTECFPFVPSYE